MLLDKLDNQREPAGQQVAAPTGAGVNSPGQGLRAWDYFFPVDSASSQRLGRAEELVASQLAHGLDVECLLQRRGGAQSYIECNPAPLNPARRRKRCGPAPG